MKLSLENDDGDDHDGNNSDDVGFSPCTQRPYRRLIYYLYIHVYIHTFYIYIYLYVTYVLYIHVSVVLPSPG
jgi:hypothetical protein